MSNTSTFASTNRAPLAPLKILDICLGKLILTKDAKSKVIARERENKIIGLSENFNERMSVTKH